MNQHSTPSTARKEAFSTTLRIEVWGREAEPELAAQEAAARREGRRRCSTRRRRLLPSIVHALRRLLDGCSN
ncbi:hypothetical protein GQ55_7G048000 [Panicum hallii var. hallii]|uniref:Uncharacterized protein n=1 Tax=Panicum hallii var. hallii TaxID=1504633 RepID=A0A2T7CSG8_9POAL|nr:hypothetical protein GQ55_7G048000 [Panicum hallii var. hallii]